MGSFRRFENKKEQMVKLPRFFLVSCLLILSVPSADASDIDLFTDTSKTLQVDLGSVNRAIVIRQRPVYIQFEALSGGDAHMIYLNFFADVHLTAVRDHTEKNPGGAFAWIGYLHGEDSGVVTLVVEDQKMTGTITSPEVSYHVRHVEGDLHLIREIRSRASIFPSAQSLDGPYPSEMTVFQLVNLEREIQNLHPLMWDDRLFEAARGHSDDMAQLDYFSHDSLDGRTFSQRIGDAGYLWNACGENIAAGYSTPQATMNGWMNSPGHRANILSSTFCDIGVGYAYEAGSNYAHYWTQDFGRQTDVISCSINQGHIILASSSPNGIISPSGSIAVTSGGSQTFSIAPDEGYRVADVIVDGTSVGPLTTYTFSNVNADHTIAATFEAQSTMGFEVTAGELTVPEGETATFQVRLSSQPSSNVNASVNRISGDPDITVQMGSSFTFTSSNWNIYQAVMLRAAEDTDITNGMATIRISASDMSHQDVVATELDNDSPVYELTIDTLGSGTIQLNPSDGPYHQGAAVTLTALPNPGWMFSGWNDALSGSDNPSTLIMNSDKRVTATFLEDSDEDGISNEQEDAGPNSGDGNNDGIADRLQENVGCLQSYNAQYYITLESPIGTTLSDCRASDKPAPELSPSGIEFPYGFISFKISGLNPGDSTTLTLYLPDGPSPETYYKYGPASNNQIDHWYEFLYDMIEPTGAEINGRVITLHFVDGQRGDDDLAADGAVIDQGGPGVISISATTSTAGADGGDGGCFISTTAYSP